MIAKDHLGKTYKSLAAMARAWGVLYIRLVSRLDLGWSIEDALTRPAGYRACCKDHTGKEFSNAREMAKAWGIPPAIYYERKHNGWSIEQILTTPSQGWKIKCKDHLGNEYESITAMAEHYKLPDTTVRARLMSLEDALTRPLRKQKRK